ncbi:MFS transporter, partial [Streptomyces anulatus]
WGAVVVGRVRAGYRPSRRPAAHPVLLASSADDARAARAGAGAGQAPAPGPAPTPGPAPAHVTGAGG